MINPIVYPLLGDGIASSISSTVLCQVLDVDQRTLCEMVRTERLAGYPIAANMSDPKGYYRPCTLYETRRYLAALDSRINRLIETRKASADNMANIT